MTGLRDTVSDVRYRPVRALAFPLWLLVVACLVRADAQVSPRDGSDRAALRAWITVLADAQFYRTTPDVTDCAALLRHAVREAVRPHTDDWHRRMRFPLAVTLPDVAARPLERDGMLPLFAVTAGVALYRGGERSQTLLPDMIRFEDHLPRAASIAELDGLIAEFHKLERGCSGTVRLYGAPKKRLERLRAALRERLTASLPESGDTDR